MSVELFRSHCVWRGCLVALVVSPVFPACASDDDSRAITESVGGDTTGDTTTGTTTSTTGSSTDEGTTGDLDTGGSGTASSTGGTGMAEGSAGGTSTGPGGTDTGPNTGTATEAEESGESTGATSEDACLLPDFGYSTPIRIDNSGGAEVANYSLNVEVDTATLVSAGQLQADCSDLSFVDDTGTRLGHYVESGCNTAITTVWVMIPTLPGASDVNIYMQYGNPAAMSTSDPATAFLFFDDFNDGTIEPWTIGVDDFESGHDGGHSATLAGAAFVSSPLSVRLFADASCASAPFNGVSPWVETNLGLPAADYCVEFDARSDVTGFSFTTTANMRRQVFIDGTSYINLTTNCMGNGCSTEGDWERLNMVLTATAIGTLRLRGRAADCTDGIAWFDDVRVRSCPAAAPSAQIGSELDCAM